MFKAYSFVFFALSVIVATSSLLDNPGADSGKTDSLATVYVEKSDALQARPPEIAKTTGDCQETKVLC